MEDEEEKEEKEEKEEEEEETKKRETENTEMPYYLHMKMLRLIVRSTDNSLYEQRTHTHRHNLRILRVCVCNKYTFVCAHGFVNKNCVCMRTTWLRIFLFFKKQIFDFGFCTYRFRRHKNASRLNAQPDVLPSPIPLSS